MCAHIHTQEVRPVHHDSKHFRNNSEPLVKSQEAPLGCVFYLKLIIHIFHNSPYVYMYTYTHTYIYTHLMQEEILAEVGMILGNWFP